MDTDTTQVLMHRCVCLMIIVYGEKHLTIKI